MIIFENIKFATAKNFSHLRKIIRICAQNSTQIRIVRNCEKFFSSAKNNSLLRRRSDVAMRRTYELFATAKNSSHLRKIFRKNGEFRVHLRNKLRKWTQNSPCFRSIRVRVGLFRISFNFLHLNPIKWENYDISG